MSKAFGAGFLDGLLLANEIKTGVDASESGITILVIKALGQTEPSFPTTLIVIGIGIVATVGLVYGIVKSPFEFGIGFVAGFLIRIIA